MCVQQCETKKSMLQITELTTQAPEFEVGDEIQENDAVYASTVLQRAAGSFVFLWMKSLKVQNAAKIKIRYSVNFSVTKQNLTM